jgi:nicotinamidase-related amidase
MMQKQFIYPFRSQRPPKFAMVVVDMQEACRDKLGYAGASVEEGIQRTARVIRAVRETGRPAILVTYDSSPQVIREISDAAGPDSPHFTKTLQSAFTIAPFRRFLSESLSDSLIFAGWVKGICVRDSMLDAIWNGFRVITSDEILFHRSGFPPMDALMIHERIIHGPVVSYYDTSEGLIRDIRSGTGAGEKP